MADRIITNSDVVHKLGSPQRRSAGLVMAGVLFMSTGAASAEVKFRHHVGDSDMQLSGVGQTDLADVDRDGDLDFILGRQRGKLFWYEYRSADEWVRHLLGENSPSDVGAAAMDVNQDGWVDVVTGGAWYENPQSPHDGAFVRHVFDPDLGSIHDLIAADVNGDGKLDVITMSDKNDVRWYEVSPEPREQWKYTPIGPSVHSGISLGDIDRDGDQDVVRSNVWFENLGDAKEWPENRMTEPWGADFPEFANNATQTETTDLNGDGRLDVVICDGENPNSRIAWLEAPLDPRNGEWKTHPLPRGDEAPRGALHSLKLADFDNDGDVDIFTVEMEAYPGARPPRWFVWENTDGRGTLVERVVLDVNLGGHEAVIGDVDGDGDIDICAKPWRARKENALGGKMHFVYLENLAK